MKALPSVFPLLSSRASVHKRCCCWPRRRGLQNIHLPTRRGSSKGSKEKRRWLGGEIQEGCITEVGWADRDGEGVPSGHMKLRSWEVQDMLKKGSISGQPCGVGGGEEGKKGLTLHVGKKEELALHF